MTMPAAPEPRGTVLPAAPQRGPGWGGFMGAVVLISLALTALLVVVLWIWYPEIHHSGWEGWLVRLFFGLDALAGLGGVVLTVRERNLRWLLTTLAALAIPIGIALLVAQIGLISFH